MSSGEARRPYTRSSISCQQCISITCHPICLKFSVNLPLPSTQNCIVFCMKRFYSDREIENFFFFFFFKFFHVSIYGFEFVYRYLNIFHVCNAQFFDTVLVSWLGCSSEKQLPTWSRVATDGPHWLVGWVVVLKSNSRHGPGLPLTGPTG